MKKVNLFLAALILVCSALPVLAFDYANFEGNCTILPPSYTQTSCQFDANRTPSGQNATYCTYGVSTYGWDFIPTSYGEELWNTTNSAPTFVYNGAFCDFIYLSVFCNGGSNAGNQHCMCNTVGIGGCIIPGAGWTP